MADDEVLQELEAAVQVTDEVTYTLAVAVAGVVESQHSTVEGEGETWRIEVA